MIQKCPQCGATSPSDEACQHRFHLCMALEYENPIAFGTAHHLTVVCYLLQHNAYSRDVWLEARNMLAQFVRDGVTPAAMRQQNRSKLDSEHRTWNVTRGAKLIEFNAILWTHTIADVRLENPEVYCTDVIRWAVSILTDTDPLMRHIGTSSPIN